MADNVAISTGTAATIAAEDVGGVEYQRIKIVDGASAGVLGVVATSAAPAAGTVGLVVRVAGTVSIAPTVLTVNTGPTTLTVNTAPTVAGASVVAQVSGAVSITVSAVLGTVLLLGSVSNVGSVGVVNSVSAIGSINSINFISSLGSIAVVQTIGAILGLNTVVTVLTILNLNTVSTVATVATVLGTVNALDATHTQFILQVSSTSPSNAGMLLFTVYLGAAQAANTAGVSLFAIPAGKQLRIVNSQAVAAGSVSALFGAVQVVFATSAATVTVSAIGGRGPAVAIAGATTVFQAFQANAWNDIPATQTVGVGITLNTSCLLGGVQVVGYLFP